MKADSKEHNFELVKKIFSDYLEKMGHRKTPERFTILKEIYSTTSHFDIESLYIQMTNNRYRVSRATLYNTIELLLNSNLVIKHQFGSHCAQFERSYKFKQHDHFIDIEDGKVLEFCDPRLHEIILSAEKALGVKVTHHALTLFGTQTSKTEPETEKKTKQFKKTI